MNSTQSPFKTQPVPLPSSGSNNTYGETQAVHSSAEGPVQVAQFDEHYATKIWNYLIPHEAYLDDFLIDAVHFTNAAP